MLATSDGVDAADREALATGLARLSQPDRELVELKIYGSLTFREIAVITGQPHGTVATRYRRALDSLRGGLSNEFSNR